MIYVENLTQGNRCFFVFVMMVEYVYIYIFALAYNLLTNIVKTNHRKTTTTQDTLHIKLLTRCQLAQRVNSFLSLFKQASI